MDHTHEKDHIVIALPEVSDDQIGHDLVWLTERLMKTQGAETSGGFLGGEFGYGAYFENDVFMMHPFCWCDRDDCCGERVSVPNFLHKPSGTAVHWYKYIGRGMEVDLRADWRTVLRECVDSLPSNRPGEVSDD